MSYILDALRRAETERERERDHIPGLHTQQMADASLDAVLPTSRHVRRSPLTPLVIGLALATLLAVAGGVALLLSGGLARAPAPPQPAIPAIALPAPAPVQVAPAAIPPVVSPAVLPAVSPAVPLMRPVPAPAPAATQASAPTPAPVASAPPRTMGLADLPAAVRQQLPPLVVGGAMHSPDPASRMLILNGQVYREGDEPAAGVRLEQIQLRSAVFSFRGYRYAVAY